MDNSLFNKILDLHKKQLNYTNTFHDKLLICFSAIPSSGKTYVSKILEEKYKAVRLNSDDVRDIIKELIPGRNKETRDRRQEILQDYLMWFLDNYRFVNKLIILDNSIDRKYLKIKDFADKNRFKIFLIGIKVSKDVAHKRAIDRNNGKKDDNFNQNIDRWIKENKKLMSLVKPDIILDGENIDLNKLFSKLGKFIH